MYDIIFAKADMHHIDSILSILQDFDNLYGQIMNFDLVQVHVRI